MNKELENIDIIEDFLNIYNVAIDSYSSKIWQVINEKYTTLRQVLKNKWNISSRLLIKLKNNNSIFVNGDLKIDFAAGCTYLGDTELHLTPSEYKILCLLAQNMGKVLTHTYMTQKVWGKSLENDIASLRVFMATLRKKIESEPNSPQYFQTHIGVGYRMIRVE